jgi:hypothetical protein
MYELLDARKFGQHINRPLLIVERCKGWGEKRSTQLRRVFALSSGEEKAAYEILRALNERHIAPADLTISGDLDAAA